MRNPFSVLGLDASADAEQVRIAYRRLVKTCHPDKFLDPEERKAAQEKMIRLNLAYEEAMKLAVNRTSASAAFHKELDQQDALTLAAKMLRQENPEAALRQLLRASSRNSEWPCRARYSWRWSNLNRRINPTARPFAESRTTTCIARARWMRPWHSKSPKRCGVVCIP